MTLPRSRALTGIDHTIDVRVRGPSPQNPAPTDLNNQVDADRVRSLADQIVLMFLNSLPSNYVSTVGGPNYVRQFQAVAEELARIQTLAIDAYEDNDYDFTRPEGLFQFLATLVFPDALANGLPDINGDVTYREFLKRMVALLLRGSKVTTLVSGLEALSDAEVSIIERVKFLGQTGVDWTLADQFTFDVEVSKHRKTAPSAHMSVARHYHPITISVGGDGVTGEAIYDGGSGPAHTHPILGFNVQDSHGEGQSDHVHDLLSDFPDLPVVLQRNAALVLQALDPAHTLYTYRHVFRETLRNRITDEVIQFDVSDYRYEDLRRECEGLRSVDGTTGRVLPDRYLFSDPSMSFRAIRPGATLLVTTTGLNKGRHQVRDVLTFPFGNDPSGAYPYTTSPSGLSGFARVENDSIVDTDQDFGACAPNEQLTITSGPNAGTYLLEYLVGPHGGPVGIPQGPLQTLGPATAVRPAPSILRVTRRFPVAATSVAYTVDVDRLGSQRIQVVSAEDVSIQLYSPGGPFTSIMTSKGPLVGPDARPATRRDVTVTIGGSPVSVASVNPYTGEVVLTTPVAGYPPGTVTATVSYRWLRGAVFGIAGIGVRGLGLGRWDYRLGRITSSPGVGLPGGGIRTDRFQIGTGLGLHPRRKDPVRVAHRYMAFERDGSAVLNSPTSLRLNQYPGRTSTPYATAVLDPVSATYSGTQEPVAPWVSVGSFDGSVVGSSYALTTQVGSPGYWKHDLPVPVGSVVAMAARFVVDSAGVSDGVFTGAGFGFHDNTRLYYAGALTVTNPVSGVALRHLGILARPGNLTDVTSWVVGPSANGRIHGTLGSTVLTVPISTLPSLLQEGSRFQVITGSQSGTYTIEDLFRSPETGTATLVVSPAFPANPELFGNRDVDVLFEAPWDAGSSSWRIYANTRDKTMMLVFGGSSGGVMTVGASPLATPASLGPDLLPEGYGRALWGSVSRRTNRTTLWDFVMVQGTPESGTNISRGTVIDTTLSGGGDPEEDGAWYALSPFGDARVVSNRVTLTSPPADAALGTSYGYGYVDPFLNGRRVSALEAKFRVLRDTAGTGAATLSLKDTHREVVVANILYQESDGVRSIFPLDTVSLVGSVDYTQQGWSTVGNLAPSLVAHGRNMTLQGQDGDGSWGIAHLSAPTGFVEFRLSVDAFTVGTSSSRIGLSVASVLGGKGVTIDFVGPDQIALRTTPLSSPAVTFSVPWSDGAARTYRLEFDGTSVITMFVDNTALSPTTTQSAFGNTILTGTRILSTPETGSSFRATLDSLVSGNVLGTTAGLGRTLGVWLGGDTSDLNNWKIPRSDGTAAPNSDATQAVPVSMDWRSECWVRAFMDPTYGVSLIRPDLAPPSGYTGDFATESMNPSAAWVSVEYARLPRISPAERFGMVRFGKLNPGSSSIVVWGDIRYRVFSNTSTDYRASQGMVIGRWNVITSGDWLKDVTPERVLVASRTRTTVSLRPCGINADRVFSVSVNDSILDPSLWFFRSGTQEITLTNPLPQVGYPVDVVFAPGKPVTATYLQSQPLEESQTILNEGTPPVPRSQVGTGTIETVSGSGGGSLAFPPAGPGNSQYFLRDPYIVRRYENPDEASTLYDRMSFFEISDEGSHGQLAMVCDGMGPSALGLEGSSFSEVVPGPGPEAMGIGSFRTIFHASGGSEIVLGVVGPGVYSGPYTDPTAPLTGPEMSMIYPLGSTADVVPGSRDMGAYQEILMVIQLGVIPGSDVEDPDYIEDVAAPTDSPASYTLVESVDFSRVGPWTGYEEDLARVSLVYGASSLQPDGVPASGFGFMALGGSTLPDPVPVVGTL